MNFLGGLLGGGGPSAEEDNEWMAEELRKLHEVMEAGLFIMNDDIDTADERFQADNSAFHKIGFGITSFLRAVLGFEQEVMNDASKRLADAEATASQAKARALKVKAPTSSVYPPGTIYALCAAEAQIMSALVGVMNESLTEAIKGFYKLRKAFITLDGICKFESAFIKQRAARTSMIGSTRGVGSAKKSVDGARQSESGDQKKGEDVEPASDDDDEFHDADDLKDGNSVNGSYNGTLDRPGSLVKMDTEDFQAEDFNNPVDGFIFSNSNLNFGIILVVVSLIPPSFSRVLSILGFHGDRVKGIERLWRATHFKDVAGATAGLVYLMIGNIASFLDILPSEGPHAFAKDRCNILLTDMLSRFPESTLWSVEESRRLSRACLLEDAVLQLTTKESKKKLLPQLETIKLFEIALNHMFLMRFEDCANAFVRTVDLNSWSHALYYHIAAACHIELYRLYTHGGTAASEKLQPSSAPSGAHFVTVSADPVKAEEHAKKAEEYLRRVPSNIGKKKFFSRQLPFDVFVARKFNKWEERAKARKVRLADAVGVSPLVEMILFWSGFVRMRPEHLKMALQLIEFSASSHNPYWSKDDFDEHALYSLLKGVIYRCLNQFEQSRTILREGVIECGHSSDEFKTGHRDNWVAPMGRYEMAANIWKDWEATHKDVASLGAEDIPAQIPEAEKLKECSKYLEEVRRWGDYDLQVRMGIKITTGRDTLRRFGISA